jgi:hypothetical protein
MELATDNHQEEPPAPKRVRFMTDPASKKKGVRYTPTQAAYKTKASFVESLPQPTIRSLSEHHFERVFALWMVIDRHNNTILRHSDKHFFPTAARVKFELNASKRVKETTEYQTLADDTDRLLSVFKQRMKDQICLLVAMEKKSAENELRQVFAEAVVGLTAILILNDPELHSMPGHHHIAMQIIGFTFDHSPELLMHSGFQASPGIDLKKSFFEEIKKTIDKHWSCNENQYESGDIDEAELTRQMIPHMPDTACKYFNSLFFNPWKNYLLTKARQQRELQMKKYHDTNIKGTATTATAMELDNNADSINEATINDMINKRVDKKVKSINSKYDKLAEKMQRSANPKDGRGAKNSSASLKKKKEMEKPAQKKKTAQKKKKKLTNQRHTSRQKEDDDDDEADEDYNASRKGNTGTGRGPRTQSKSKKRNTTRTSKKSPAA